MLFQVLHWHKLLEEFIVALKIWLGIYESSRDPYFKTITISPEAQLFLLPKSLPSFVYKAFRG